MEWSGDQIERIVIDHRYSKRGLLIFALARAREGVEPPVIWQQEVPNPPGKACPRSDVESIVRQMNRALGTWNVNLFGDARRRLQIEFHVEFPEVDLT